MNSPQPLPVTQDSTPQVPGPNIMLIGPSGAGKTHSIRTLVDAGLEVFVVFTENGMEVLSDIPPDKLHWHYVPAATESWDTMLKVQRDVNTKTMKILADMAHMNKQEYPQFLELITQFQNFQCQRTGKDFGDCTTWGTDRALVVDSLSGLNIMAMNHVVGGKPVKSVQNWGVAMDGLEKLIQKLTLDTACTFVMTAHMEREVDELTGQHVLMASTLGRKLAPKIPRFFSDVIQCVREGSNWSWRTATVGVDTKARNLPWQENLEPSFVNLLKTWKERQAKGYASSSTS